jgi:hypothetical protein
MINPQLKKGAIFCYVCTAQSNGCQSWLQHCLRDVCSTHKEGFAVGDVKKKLVYDCKYLNVIC